MPLSKSNGRFSDHCSSIISIYIKIFVSVYMAVPGNLFEYFFFCFLLRLTFVRFISLIISFFLLIAYNFKYIWSWLGEFETQTWFDQHHGDPFNIVTNSCSRLGYVSKQQKHPGTTVLCSIFLNSRFTSVAGAGRKELERVREKISKLS